MNDHPEVNAFLTYVQKEKQLAANTVKNYTRDLAQFMAYLHQENIDHPIRVLPKNIRHFMSLLRHKGLSSRSIARMLSSVRQFYHYLIREKFTDTNPAVGIHPPKGARNLPSPPDVDKTHAMFKAKVDAELEVRDIAMIEVTYACGLRLSELVTLAFSMINSDEQTLSITGKGRKMRIIPMGERAIEAIQRWSDLRNTYMCGTDDHDIIFTSKQGRPLSARGVQKRFERFGRHYTDFHLHPHLLRHAFASHLLESSGNLRAVQTLLGHASIVSTQVYTHLDFQHLADTYDQAHPRAKRKR